MRLAKPIVLMMVLILSGCQGFFNGGSAVALTSLTSSEDVDIAELEKLAYLTVVSLRLEPESVDSGHAFSAILLVRNDGETESRPFEVEVQANLITKNSVTSYPLGGKIGHTIKPHQVAQFTVTRKEGLNTPGIYTIIVSLHSANLETPLAIDRFNPKTPKKQLIVKQRLH
jgi:hypothetical protein